MEVLRRPVSPQRAAFRGGTEGGSGQESSVGRQQKTRQALGRLGGDLSMEAHERRRSAQGRPWDLAGG